MVCEPKLLNNVWRKSTQPLTAVEPLEDRLFLIDASASMKEKVANGGPRKIDIVKEGLIAFCQNLWPVSYYDNPLRIGIVAFRLLGTPGNTHFEVIVPLYPSPTSLELYRLRDLKPKGGCYIADGLEYAKIVMTESERQLRRLDVVSDGGFTGPDPAPVAKSLADLGVLANCIELGANSSNIMQEIASQSRGTYRLVSDLKDFMTAVSAATVA